MQLTWQDRGQPQGAVGLGVPRQPSPTGIGEWGGAGEDPGDGQAWCRCKGETGWQRDGGAVK